MLGGKLIHKLLFVFATLILFSCNQTPLAKSLSETNRLVIHFIEKGKIVKTVSTVDKAAIKKMIYALDKGEAKTTNCEINGRMIFYNNDTELQQVDFSNKPGCQYYSYRFENTQSYSAMTNETANFLQSVKEGLDFY